MLGREPGAEPVTRYGHAPAGNATPAPHLDGGSQRQCRRASMGPRRRTWPRSLDRDIMCSSLNGRETHVYPEMKAFGFLFLFSWMSLAGTRIWRKRAPKAK